MYDLIYSFLVVTAVVFGTFAVAAGIADAPHSWREARVLTERWYDSLLDRAILCSVPCKCLRSLWAVRINGRGKSPTLRSDVGAAFQLARKGLWHSEVWLMSQAFTVIQHFDPIDAALKPVMFDAEAEADAMEYGQLQAAMDEWDDYGFAEVDGPSLDEIIAPYLKDDPRDERP